MIRILYNPDYFELVFSVATIMLKHEETEGCLVIPTTIDTLFDKSPNNLSLENILASTEDDDYNFGEMINYLPKKEQEKTILLGIHPENKEENLILVDFLDQYQDDIYLWVDNHYWPSDLINYAQKTNKKFFVSKHRNCLQTLKKLGYYAPQSWLKAEKAMIEIDLRNKLAARYIQAMLVNRTTGNNYDKRSDYDFFLFMSIVNEITSKKENLFISGLENLFIDMMAKTQYSKKRLSDKHPIFQTAKKRGRSVGYLSLNEIDNYLDIEGILEYGCEKFPWLCILEYQLEGNPYIYIESKKMPIKEIMLSYKDLYLDHKTTLKILNAELLNYHSPEKEKTNNKRKRG